MSEFLAQGVGIDGLEEFKGQLMIVDHQKLKGQDNYTRWKRDFKCLAQVNGVWRLITGERPILPKPNRGEYQYLGSFQPGQKTTTTTTKEAAEEGEEEAEVGTSEVSDLHRRIAECEYTLDLEQYEKNKRLVRLASALIVYGLDPAIRDDVPRFDAPPDAWKWIESRYKMPDARARHIAYARLNELKLVSCVSLSDYLNQLEMCRQDIQDAGGQYPDERLISRIISGLPPSYRPFIMMYRLDQHRRIDGFTKFTNCLLTFELDLRMIQQQQLINQLN
ncbi:MAG: hypothetical protein M1837_000528 [Sclerophora amabilis]|nr:MAG: hypothetical protein M1837_000528 [Sclerophora amabilis]